MNERGELAEIFFELDNVIAWYLKSNEIVEQECGYSNGRLKIHSKLNEYETRRRKVRQDYEAKCFELVGRLDDVICKLPANQDVYEKYLAAPPKFIRKRFTLGELQASYDTFNRRSPLCLNLPVARPLCVAEENGKLLLQVMMSLLFTLPPGLCQFHIYDPCHFGNSVGRFDVLRDLEKVFPDKEFLYDEKDFKSLLDNLSANFANMRQKLFPAQNCRSWREYNQNMRRMNLSKKQLPYTVLVCFELPELCKQEHLTALKRLSDEGANFGFLLLYSYRAEALIERKVSFDGSIEAYQNDRAYAALRAIYKNSAPLDKAFTRLNELDGLNYLRLEEKISPPPEPHTMEKFLRKWQGIFLTRSKQPIDFDELIRQGKFFDSSAVDGLQIPLGLRTQDNEIIKLPVCDQPPHTLIAGATGSGKSNLLHVLICNACSRYSPDELNLYLLDFKDGVEFATYAKSNLPHAKLIATQADAFYAQTVLEHLAAEVTRRNNLFKKISCSNYRDFRKKNPANKLPRIILIIDEFQRLFESDANYVTELLKYLATQGRSEGLHMIFATQSLKNVGGNAYGGLGFSQVESQFNGRIALKCSADDSKRILWQNNEAAVDLTLGLAILNTEGNIKGNQKFAVPEAKAESVTATIKELNKIAADKAVQTKIFDGQELPKFPDDAAFHSDAVTLLLGRQLNYDADNFCIELPDKPEQNILFCGQVESFFACALKFAATTKIFEERVYVGNRPPEGWQSYPTPQEFFAAIKDSPFDKRRLIILDGCEFPPAPLSPAYAKPEQLEFFNFWQKLCEHGSHMLAFYETFNRLKVSSLDYTKYFAHRVAYHLPQSNMAQLGGIQLGTKPFDDRFKAAYLFSEHLTWFQPFAEI